VCDGSEQGKANGNFVVSYFMQRQEDITEESLARAFPNLSQQSARLDENTAEYFREATKLSASEQDDLLSWVPPRGVIKNDYNYALLIKYIKSKGWLVSHEKLTFAAGQNKIIGLLQWDYSQTHQRVTDPRQHHDSPTDAKIPTNEPLWKRLKREREAREPNPQAAAKLSADQATWKQMLLDKKNTARTHSQKQAYEAAANPHASHGDYRRAYEAVLPIWREFNKPGFIGR